LGAEIFFTGLAEFKTVNKFRHLVSILESDGKTVSDTEDGTKR